MDEQTLNDSQEGVEHVEESEDEESGDERDKEVQLVDLQAEVGEAHWPVPTLSGDEVDRKALIDEQTRDTTLKSARQWAERAEKGFGYQDGILVHCLVAK